MPAAAGIAATPLPKYQERSFPENRLAAADPPGVIHHHRHQSPARCRAAGIESYPVTPPDRADTSLTRLASWFDKLAPNGLHDPFPDSSFTNSL
jgi:hypothetical protein